MIIPLVSEMEVGGVADRGEPNKERIILRPRIPINLQNFILGIAIARPDGVLLPVWNNVYYFDDIVVDAFSWVIVYTGPGKSEISVLPTTREKAYSFHWGQPQVVFTRVDLVPLLFRIIAIAFPGSQNVPPVPPLPTISLPAVGHHLPGTP